MSDISKQALLLPGVSRSFGFTIPELPAPLRVPVTNAYLLCRIADTIEDSTALSVGQKELYQRQFLSVLREQSDSRALSNELIGYIGHQIPESERRLIEQIEIPVSVFQTLSSRQRQALDRCLDVMIEGMARYQRNQSLSGLPTMPDLDDYCFHVAGVVGQMLTEFFCDYAADIDANGAALREHSVSFGQGLQMTNILKDVWEDRARGACWLPNELFAEKGCDLENLDPVRLDPGYGSGIADLVDEARHHLEYALEYTLLIPKRHRGIRKFCLWAVDLAMITLGNIAKNPNYRSGHEIKVSRSEVRLTGVFLGVLTGSNRAQRRYFQYLNRTSG